MAGIYKAPKRPGYKTWKPNKFRGAGPTPQAPPGGWTDFNRQTGVTTEADYNWKPNPGEGVQDLINSGRITWDQGLGNIGYTQAVRPRKPPPDYASLIAGDWEVQDAEAAMAAQMARARGDFQTGLRQQFIDLGIGDTSKLGKNLGRYINADTIKAAVANKYSLTAQNKQQADRNSAMSNASLAARGILNSGQTSKNLTDITAAQEGANYAGLRDFLEGGAQGLTGLADTEFGLSQGVAAARSAAAARAAQQYPWDPDEEDPDAPAPGPTGAQIAAQAAKANQAAAKARAKAKAAKAARDRARMLANERKRAKAGRAT